MIDHVLIAADQVTAALQNSDGTQNIYISSDPAVNALSLTLRNGLGHSIVFPPGTPGAYEKLPPGQSAVYIYLNGLIDNADIAGIALSATDWSAGSFVDPASSLRYLVIAPASQVTVEPGGTLTFSLANVLVKGSPRSGTADIDLAGATGVTPPQSDVPLFINIANPPQPGKKKLDVKIGFDVPVVYTGATQSLTLHLVNGGQTPLVPGGTPSWHGITPTFQLTLVYGDGAGALTTVAKAAQLAMAISDEYGNIWQPPQRHVQGQRPYWIMQPDPNGGGTVLGTGENASIEFRLSGIDAALPSGLDSAITVAYVSWHDVPGYNDSSTTVIITKRAGPRVTSFTADPASVQFGQASVQTVLTWDTAHATGVRFDAPQVNPAQTFWTSGSGPIGGGINVQRGTTVTVIAYKDISQDREAGTGGAGELPQPEDDVITAKASLLITGATRTDVTAGIGSLGAIVTPAGSTSAFIFQMNEGRVWTSDLTKGVVLDLETNKFIRTLDIKSLIPPPQAGGILIQAAASSPDGTTIHLLASSGAGASHVKPEFYLLPVNVASIVVGQPVSVGTLVPSGRAYNVTLLTTPDGRTLYVSAGDLDAKATHVYAFDAVTYTQTGSWTWQIQPDQQQLGPAAPAAANADGSVLLMAGWAGLAIIDVAHGFAMTSILNLGKQLGLLMGSPVVSADQTRSYVLGVDNPLEPVHGHVLAVDVDLPRNSLSLAKDIRLGLVPALAGPAALSPDAKTLYMLTAIDVLTAYDTGTFRAVPYSCGANGQFTPLEIVSGTHPNVLYSTGNNQLTTGTVSIINIT